MATKAPKNDKALNAELENALFSDVERCEMFFTQHWKAVVAAALAGVVAITAVFAVHTRAKAQARNAASRLSEASSIAELESAISQYSRFPGADMARYRLAGAYIEKKEYEKALKTLAAVILGTDAALRSKARMTEAYTLELSGKNAEAAQKFAALSAAQELSASARAEAACSAGRLLIGLGKKAEARTILNSVSGLNIPPGSQSAGYWKDNAVELAKSIE